MKSHVTNEPVIKNPSNKVVHYHNTIRIHQVVLNADSRYMLPGLIELCAKLKIKVEEKPQGNMIVFINTARNMVKVICCNETVAPLLCVYRMPEGRIYDLSVVQEIPKALNSSGKIDFDIALKLALEKKLGTKGE